MNTVEINDLEYRVDDLIGSVERLRNENQSLRHKLTSTTRECSRLRELNKKAAIHIRRIITQLKDELS